jgi:CRP-like cAMP-binding protein
MLSDGHGSPSLSFSLSHSHCVRSQGESGDAFYIISDGTVSVMKDGRLVNRLGPGHFFGERALIKDESRAADVIAVTAVQCMVLSRKAFIEILGPIELLWKVAQLQAVPTLSTLTEDQLERVAGIIEEIKVPPGKQICKKGEQGNSLYIVVEGSVAVTEFNGAGPDEVIHLKTGAFFGERALLHDNMREATVVASEGTVLWCLSSALLTKQLGQLSELLWRWRARILNDVELFQDLSTDTRNELAQVRTKINK